MISIRLAPTGLWATTPSGREVLIPATMQGMHQLLSLARWDARNAPPPSEAPKPGVTMSELVKYFPSEWQRVCHCGKEVHPFMERCEDCPGHSGAGKVKKFDQRGRRTNITLAELGLGLKPAEQTNAD